VAVSYLVAGSPGARFADPHRRQNDRIDLPEHPTSAQDFISRVGWRFASTMPEIPHEYTVGGRETAGIPPVPEAWYDWFVEQIREHGYEAKFAGRTYTYLDVDGHKYWALVSSDDVLIINRARLGPEESA
jgi:hypothetical protein